MIDTNEDEKKLEIKEISQSKIKTGVDIRQNEHFVSRNSQIFILMIIVFYNFYPRLMLNAVKILSCISIDDSDLKFMEADISSECWGTDHIIAIFLLCFSNVFIWGILTPALTLVFASKLKKIENKTSNENLKKIIDFITMDYKPNLFVWELFNYLQKFIVALVSVAISSLDSSSQGALIILIFLIFFLIHERFKPYNYDFINNIKTLSYIVTICLISFAILASSKQALRTQRIFFIMMAAISTSIFYVVWIIYFIRVQRIKHKKNFLLRCCSRLKKKFKNHRKKK